MLTLYHASWSRSGRIVWLLEELGIDYDIVQVDIARPQFGIGARDPKNRHPDGKVPAIKDGDALVSESAAIALYLTERHPEANLGAEVGSPERAAFLTWITWIAGELEPSLWARMAGDTAADLQARARFEAAFARLTGALERGPYLMGERFTAVDVMVGSTLAWAKEHLPENERMDAYLERALSRPANARATEKDGTPPEATEAA